MIVRILKLYHLMHCLKYIINPIVMVMVVTKMMVMTMKR